MIKCPRNIGVVMMSSAPLLPRPEGKSDDQGMMSSAPLLPRPEGKSDDEGMMSSVSDDDHNTIKLANDMATFLQERSLWEENGWIELSYCCTMLRCTEDDLTTAMKLSDCVWYTSGSRSWVHATSWLAQRWTAEAPWRKKP
jgi:hypothetical protein